jgi:hypothetical protein
MINGLTHVEFLYDKWPSQGWVRTGENHVLCKSVSDGLDGMLVMEIIEQLESDLPAAEMHAFPDYPAEEMAVLIRAVVINRLRNSVQIYLQVVYSFHMEPPKNTDALKKYLRQSYSGMQAQIQIETANVFIPYNKWDNLHDSFYHDYREKIDWRY